MPIRLMVNACLVALGAGLIASSAFRVVAGHWTRRRAAEDVWVGLGTLLIAAGRVPDAPWATVAFLAGCFSLCFGLVLVMRRVRSRAS